MHALRRYTSQARHPHLQGEVAEHGLMVRRTGGCTYGIQSKLQAILTFAEYEADGKQRLQRNLQPNEQETTDSNRRR